MSDSETKPTTPRYTADTRMGDAMVHDSDLAVILMRFHIGGCSLCGFEADDTVAQVAEDNGVPVEILLGALNREE